MSAPLLGKHFAVFCLLIFSQIAYLLEQVARIVRVAALDGDRGYLVWTSWAVLGVLLLVSLALALQLGRMYDASLAGPFRQSPEGVLIDRRNRLEEVRLRPGERVEHVVQRRYMVTRGTGVLIREGPGGHDILLNVLAPGQIVRAYGTLQAETALELLALPAGAV